MAEDELSQARDHFSVGCFNRALVLVQNSGGSFNEIVAAEKEAIIAGSKLALGMLSKVDTDTWVRSGNPSVKASGLYLNFLNAESDKDRRAAVEELTRLVSNSHDPTAKLITAGVLTEAGDFTEGLRLTDGEVVEMMALKVQLLLLVDRVDLAEQTLAKMSTLNDDAAVTKLASAWVNIVTGNCQESYLTFVDLHTLYAQGDQDEKSSDDSLILLNGMAVANMQRQLWSEALDDLLRGQKLKAGESNVEILANLITCHRHMRKDESADTHFAKLRELAPKHPMVTKVAELHQEFQKFKIAMGT